MEEHFKGNQSVKIKDPITKFETSYSMSIRLKKNLDEKVIHQLQKKDKDCVLVIDGKEGCQPAGEKVLMADGSWKNVEDIQVGDLILSPQRNGSHTFSKVLKTYQWFCDEIYDVVELNKKKKKLYSCSYNHLIPINIRTNPRINGKRNFKKDNYWDIRNYQASYLSSLSKDFKKNTTTLLSFPIDKFMGRNNFYINPYCLGVWLGDGHFTDSLSITTEDKEIIDYFNKIYPNDFLKSYKKNKSNASSFRYSTTGKFAEQLKKSGLRYKKSGTKFIPKEALLSDIDYRSKLLAGLIDTDGYYDKDKNSYSIITKSEQLSEDIYQLLRGLGFRGTISKVKKKIKSIGFEGQYYEIRFYTCDSILPTKLNRKTSKGNSFYLSSNRTSIDVKKSKSKMVYGFTLDSESSWYITEDYIITHNSGKSTLAMQIGKYVDPTLNLSRIVFSPDDFREAILKAKKGQCIIYDEAFTGFSSRSSLSPVNRVLVSLAMQMRQKNLFILIVLPTIFLLDKYMAIFRTRALIHVFESKGRRGYFKVYNSNKKRYLILMGQKTMTYKIKGLWTNFKGRFYGKFALGDEEVEKMYRSNKEKALSDSEKTSMSSSQVRFREQRDLLIWMFRKNNNYSYRELSELFAQYDLTLSYVQIRAICVKFGDKENKKDLDQQKEIESNK